MKILREFLDELDFFPFPLDLLPVIAVFFNSPAVPAEYSVDNAKNSGGHCKGETGEDPRIGEAHHHLI